MVVHQAQEHLVQEVAADGAPPSRYVLREHDRPTPATNAAIPTVDVSRLAANDPDEAEKLRSALNTWGLFAVTGHGMPGELLDAILDSTRAFFHLPTHAKHKYSNLVPSDSDDSHNNNNNKKFQPEGYGVDRVDTDEQILDWCDRLYLQVQPEDERRRQFWPTEPPNLAGLLHDYSLKSQAVAQLILRAMARILGFEESFFVDKVGDESRMPSYARFTYYPPCARPDLVYGLKPHTDNSVVTVLLLDKRVGGLQVRQPLGDLAVAGEEEEGARWVDVPAMGGHELLVVVGDEMEIMSNAAFRAPVHRVVVSAEERMSLVVFYQPEPHRALEPARELVDEERPARYKTLQAKTFADGFWDAFALGERTIDFLKVKVGEDGGGGGGDQPNAPAAVPGA